MNKVEILHTKKEWLYFILILMIISIFTILFHYNKYQNLTKENIIEIEAKVINQYIKHNKKGTAYNVLKCNSNYGTFYTTIWGDIKDIKLQYISLKLITKNITFYAYLKGFFAPTFNEQILFRQDSRYDIYQNINTQHQDNFTKELFNALFLAIPVSHSTREIFTNLGISHLVALSGFHLALLTSIIFFIINPIYKPIQQRYFPYRNRYHDIVFFVLVILLFYLHSVDYVPSLLRSYVMFLVGWMLYLRYIDIFNFKSLFIVILLILAFLPKLLFSLGFLLSISGVYFIYLFLQYFSHLNKWFLFIAFNFYIYTAMLPIVHFYFDTITIYQLLSPILTLLFTIFYPLSLLLHILGIGGLTDGLLLPFVNIDYTITHYMTTKYELIIYLSLAFFSIWFKKVFILFNIFLLYFISINIYSLV